MMSRSGQKIRLVKCPKCFKILQEDEDVPVYQCGGCSTILQAKRRNVTPNNGGERDGGQASVSETNNVSNMVEKARYESIESIEKQLDRLELSTNEIQEEGDTEKSEGDDDENSRLESRVMNNVVEAAGSEASFGRLSVVSDHVVAGRESYSSGNAEISPDASLEKNEEDDKSRFESLAMNNVVEVAGFGASVGSLSVVSDHVVAARESYSSGNAEISPDASQEKNEEDDNVMNTVAEAAGSEASSGRLSVVSDHVVVGRESYSSGNAEISPDASPEKNEEDDVSHVMNNVVEAADSVASSGNAEISPYASPLEEKQSRIDYPANKNSSAYDGSESSSDEREEDQLLDENEQWKVLQKMRSGKFEMPRYPGNYKASSSSSTFFEKRRNGITTTYNERYQNRSMQLEVQGRQGRRRHVSEQLRPDIPLYPREPYTRVSPSYLSQEEFDRYSHAHSLQMPPYTRGMNHECVDYTRGRGRGQGRRFSGEIRNRAGWYSSQLLHDSYSSYSASPQRDYYPRWSHELVSDMEDHHNHHRELQIRRQRVAKRHIRPTAGGAPFINCYSCFENLQLPEDFLIFNRKYHLLRCGTCTTVLRFSLQSRTHLVPDVTHDMNASRSSHITSETPREPEKLSSSVQDEDLPVARVSPLHRLMGYSTVSQVFKASQRPPSI